MGQVVIHGSSDQLVKIYSGTLVYQYDITKFLGSWHFRFGRKKIYKFSAKYPLKTINTFLASVKMHTKVIPTNGKHILNSPVGYITKLKKKIGIALARHATLILILWCTAPSCNFKAVYLAAPTRSQRLNFFKWKNSKPLTKFKWKVAGISLAHRDFGGQRSNFSNL